MNNWLDCMRSRKQPNADVVNGHYSSMACHIGNIAYQQRCPGHLAEGVGSMSMEVGVNMEFIRSQDKPFAAGVERSGEAGLQVRGAHGPQRAGTAE